MITKDIKKIINSLENQEIVSIPTDTVYGLSCMINKAAVQNLIKLKQRDCSKGFIIISANPEYLLDYVDTSKLDNHHIDKLVSKTTEPTTWIVPAKESIKWLTGDRDTLAIRLVQTQVLKTITNTLEDVIISTSANISGLEPCRNIKDINKTFPTIQVLECTSTSKNSKPSRIINLLNEKQLR